MRWTFIWCVSRFHTTNTSVCKKKMARAGGLFTIYPVFVPYDMSYEYAIFMKEHCFCPNFFNFCNNKYLHTRGTLYWAMNISHIVKCQLMCHVGANTFYPTFLESLNKNKDIIFVLGILLLIRPCSLSITSQSFCVSPWNSVYIRKKEKKVNICSFLLIF